MNLGGLFTYPFPVQLGSQAPAIFTTDFLVASGTPATTAAMATAAHTLRLLSYMVGLWLWGLSVWFFLVSVGSLWKYLRPESKGKLRFQMTWFSFVFPNTALVGLRLVLVAWADGDADRGAVVE